MYFSFTVSHKHEASFSHSLKISSSIRPFFKVDLHRNRLQILFLEHLRVISYAIHHKKVCFYFAYNHRSRLSLFLLQYMLLVWTLYLYAILNILMRLKNNKWAMLTITERLFSWTSTRTPVICLSFLIDNSDEKEEEEEEEEDLDVNWHWLSLGTNY